MKQPSPFTVFDAAAGSGKTFTLVKEYLKTILATTDQSYYRHILAVTFTNKAVAEMKERILQALAYFSETPATKHGGFEAMLYNLVVETNLSKEIIKQRSTKILSHILHNYASFSVETIDGFNHRLLRTFARDLKLSTNFEVNLDTKLLLEVAVDRLLTKAGNETEITKLLVSFALQKADDDTSWDISLDIKNIASILFSENDVPHVSKLKGKTLYDFSALKKYLKAEIKTLETAIHQKSTEVLTRIESVGLDFTDFNRSTLPNHFQSLQAGNYNVYANQIQQNLELEAWNKFYTQKTSATNTATIISLLPYIKISYFEIKTNVYKTKLYQSVLKNSVPLSVINLVSKEIENLKLEKNSLPISEFNTLINNEIKNQPAPFIYERLGERYHHFFIDEFQDTSKMQWENFMPLLDNSLSQQIENKSGSVLLVGDAKQSIYRWRGGDPEQFIQICGTLNPFPSVQKVVENLDTNRRSREEIIAFNNKFFQFAASIFGNSEHAQLYLTGNNQKINSKKNGYVTIEFIEPETKVESEELYAQKTLLLIQQLKSEGFSESDICILTRKRKEGIEIGTYLLHNNVPIVSSETLLLAHSSNVRLLMSLFAFSLNLGNESLKYEFLTQLYYNLKIAEPLHTFFTKFKNCDTNTFQTILKEYGVNFNLHEINSKSIYEGFEYCIRQFKLADTADAYLFGFMDFVFDFEQKNQGSRDEFLDYWELKKESAAISSGSGLQAITLMTIHKSKGLEFPVVIFPYADVAIYDEIKPRIWFPLPENSTGFTEATINYNSDVAEFGDDGANAYQQRRSMLELDAINMLYVTLTRAVDRLYIISQLPSEPKDGSLKNYNLLFKRFLENQGKWQDGTFIYEFGDKNTQLSVEKIISKQQVIPQFIATPPESHNLNISTGELSLTENELKKAINVGTLFHETMELIKTKNDLTPTFEKLYSRKINSETVLTVLFEKIDATVNHPELKNYFDGSDLVYIERELSTKSKKILRPDRLNFHTDGSITIIDYKTGEVNKKNLIQIEEYADALQDMGHTIAEKIIVYTTEKGVSINKV